MASLWRKLTGGSGSNSPAAGKKATLNDNCIDKFDLLSRSYDGGIKMVGSGCRNDSLKRVGSLQDRHRIFPAPAPGAAAPLQNFKRINSLPPAKLTLNKKKHQASSPLLEEATTAAHELPLKFDMIRHHLGQTDCGTELAPCLADLETSVLLLSEKLKQMQHLRQECMRKMAKLKLELESSHRQQQQMKFGSGSAVAINNRQRKSWQQQEKAYHIRLQFVENFMRRLESLLQEDRQPLIAPITGGAETGPPIIAQASTTDESSNAKRAQIQQCYDYMLKSVMPQFYGKRITPNDSVNKSTAVAGSDPTDAGYQHSRRMLEQLRTRVMGIATQQEQQLIDAKRAFLQEVDAYIRTLDQNDLQQPQPQTNTNAVYML